MALFAGSPLYNVYLRLLGMKIGRNSVVVTTMVPVCTDLISIGDNTLVRRDAVLQGYKARSGLIQTGKISIGNNAFVGEAGVLDIDTAMEDDTQLGHSSSLHSRPARAEGQALPRLARAGDRGRLLPAGETERLNAPARALFDLSARGDLRGRRKLMVDVEHAPER